MDLKHSSAIVTGGGSGMGRCFVEQLAKAGAKVFFCDVNPEAIAQTSEDFGVQGTLADVSKEEDVKRLFDEAEAAIGPINTLINNAGILRDGLLVKKDRKTGEVRGLSKAKWDAVISVNLTGPFLCMREFATRAVENEIQPAVAVNMSSISRAGNYGQSNYAAAKAGLVADTVLWAKELARYKVRVGAIAPGFIATPMVAGMPPAALEKAIAPVPLKRLGEPVEIWQAIKFIVECEYFTGRVVEVDGGLRL